MNSEIKSLIETSPEVRDFELRDVTELEIWLSAIRIEGLLTGYFANYVGDSDGLFLGLKPLSRITLVTVKWNVLVVTLLLRISVISIV